MTEAEARARLAAIRNPNLDALRARIPTTRTSELIAMLTVPDAFPDLDADELSRDERVTLHLAATMALADEIDRRIPVQTCPHRSVYVCSGCDLKHCMDCDAPSEREEYKTAVRWCPRCRAEGKSPHEPTTRSDAGSPD